MDMSDAVSARLAQVRGDLSQEEFAARLGIHRHTLAKYEKGLGRASAAFLEQVAHAGINPIWLMTGQGSPSDRIETQEPDTKVKLPAHEQENWVTVPRYASVRLSAGKGLAPDVDGIDELAFRRQYLQFIGVSKNTAAIVRVRGDSMEPLLRDGDTVLIDTADKALFPPHRDQSRRRMYAISQEGTDGDSLRCKYVELTGEPDLLLVSSANPDYAQEQVNTDRLRVIGRVRWSGHTWF